MPAVAPAAATPAATGATAATAHDEPAPNWPFIVTLAYLFVDYGRPQNWFAPIGSLRPGMIVLSAGALALVVTKRMHFPTPARWMAAFIGIMAIGVPFASNNFWAFTGTKDLALLVFAAIAPMMTFVDTPRRVTIFFRFWIVVHLLLGVYGITHGGRGIGSFLGDENDFCLAINMALPYAFFMLPIAKTWRGRLVLAVAICIFLFSIMASFSRGGFVGLVAIAVCCWLRAPRKMLSLVAVAVLAAVVALFGSEAYWKEMQTIQTADSEDDTGGKRLYYWSVGWKMFLDQPIMGVGPKNFEFSSYRYESEEQRARGINMWGKAAHSLYFTMLPEVGIVGTSAYLMIVITAWGYRRSIRKGYQQRFRASPESITPDMRNIYFLSGAVDVSLIAFLVTGAFISVLYYPHFWVLTGFTVILKRNFDAEVARADARTPGPSLAAPAVFRFPR